MLEATKRAENRLIAKYSDNVISAALRELPIADLPSVKLAIVNFYNDPTNSTTISTLEEQIRLALPRNQVQELIVSAATDYLTFLWEELTVLPEMRARLGTLGVLRIEHRTGEIQKILHSIDEKLSNISIFGEHEIPIKRKSDNIKWENVSNLFWLGHDLRVRLCVTVIMA